MMPQKAPGKSHREGITLIQLTRMFPDNETAERWFIEQRWPDGVHCPACGSTNIQKRPTRKPAPFRCRDCRKDFSTKTGTLMQGSNLGFQTWAMAIYLFNTSLKGVSSMKLHRDLGVTQKTAWHLAHRIRETWQDNTDAPFCGPVEADETYVGGKLKNMHAKKRREARQKPDLGKTIVAGVKDRPSKRVSARVVESTEAATLHPFVTERTTEDATVYTDEGKGYSGLPRERETVKHSAGEYVKGDASTNGMEGFWSMVKRGYQGTYHHWSPKHTDRYVRNSRAGTTTARPIPPIRWPTWRRVW